jgi:organic hydroperoxide reductase OsmC/OhrA
MAITRIALRPRIAFAGAAPGADQLATLHHEAHELCFIANSLKAEIVVEPA